MRIRAGSFLPALFAVVLGLLLFFTAACELQRRPATELPSEPGWEASEPQGDTSSMPTLEDIVNRYVDALGGREAIERLETRVSRGRIVTDLPSREPPVLELERFEFSSTAQGRFLAATALEMHNPPRTDGSSPQGADTEGFDGETGWRIEGDRVTLDESLGRSRFAWLLNPQGPLQMGRYFRGMRLKGVREVEGRLMYVVDTDEDFSLYFDVETGLLARAGFNRELANYREVDGVLVPHQILYSRKGGSSTFVFDEIEHGVPLSDERFLPEKPGA
jgi:hypothetical protein